jgi:hypothetical protein
MVLSDRTAAIVPYAQQLLENNDVRDTARQATDATRAAYQRARGQDARKAVQDRRLRRHVIVAVATVGKFVGAVSKAPPKQKSRWPRRAALLAFIGAGAWLINNTGVRVPIARLVGQNRSDDPTTSSKFDEPNPSSRKEAS